MHPLKNALVLAALLLVACDGEGEPEWRVVHSDLDEGLMSVWGRSSTDVYAVGSDLGSGPLVLRWDGEAWTRLRTGESGDLWWVNGVPEGPTFMGGAGGLILRYEDGTFTRMETPSEGTVFGIWAAAEDDVWAVGGIGALAGFAWHFDGSTWNVMTLPEIGDRGLFKVWGTASDDVWLVGAAGAMYHWDGESLSPVDAGTTRTLFTVHVDGDRAYAVGGAGNAALVEREDGVWIDQSPEFVAQLFGVCSSARDAWAVGLQSTIVRRTEEGWVQEEADIGTIQALHAVWIDETDGVWAVGGQVIAAPLSGGTLVHRGPTAPMGAIEEGS